MPVTFITMTIGLAALAGVPPFAGFFSKDAILAAACDRATGGGVARAGRRSSCWSPGSSTVGLTAWYATRLWLRTFFGDYRGDGQPHDPPPLMRWPVLLLAVPAALLGFAGLSASFATALEGPGGSHAGYRPWDAASLISFALVVIGVAGALATWRRDRAADPARVLGAARPVFANAFYLDDVQDALVARPVYALASLVKRGDSALVDGAVEGTATGTMRIGGWAAMLAPGRRCRARPRPSSAARCWSPSPL